MGNKVDFHPVEDGERSDDAICLRFGDLNVDHDPWRTLIAPE